MNYNNELPLMASGLALFRSIIYCNEPLRHNVTAAILAMVEEVAAAHVSCLAMLCWCSHYLSLSRLFTGARG